MTPIPAIDFGTDAATSGAWRDGVSAALGNFRDLGARPWSEVARIEIFPGSLLGDPEIVVPEGWMPAGALRRQSFRTLDPTFNGLLADDDPDVASVRDESVRRALLALWLPRRTNTGVRVYAPSSWLAYARALLRAVAWQVDQRPSPDGRVWSHLSAADLLALQNAISTGERGRSDVRHIIRSLADAGERGLLNDFPRSSKDSPKGGESSNKGAAPLRATKTEERNWLPFPDEFVSELIWRALWIQRNLAPQLLECWAALKQITAEAADRGMDSGHPAVINRRRRHMQTVDWRDRGGRPITRLPFPIVQRSGTSSGASDTWPPDSSNSINLLVGVVQVLNLSVVAFCAGARAGEIASATDESLVGLEAHRLQARTFKLIDEIGGQVRDWPLHPAAADALDLQVKLARSIRPEGTNHLWVLAGRGGSEPIGSPLLNLTEPLAKTVEHLGLSELTGKGRAHFHRWRHTVARIVALSVVGAPQVLLDLFGHKDLEMTLRYMLSSPEIAQEAMRVAKETAFALAEEAIEETLAGETDGPAAPHLKHGLDELRMRRGEDVFGADGLRELADILTFGGKQWEIVRPGVICTKAPGQFGPCTQGLGEPDPGSCRTSCDHRLETSRAKAQCDAAISALLLEIEAAEADGADMLLENLKGQTLAQLRRWEDVRANWISQSAVAARLWEER